MLTNGQRMGRFDCTTVILVNLFHVLVPRIPACESRRELKPHFFPNVVMVPVQMITFQDRTMESKAQPMKNTKAIISHAFFLHQFAKVIWWL